MNPTKKQLRHAEFVESVRELSKSELNVKVFNYEEYLKGYVEKHWGKTKDDGKLPPKPKTFSEFIAE